MAQCKSEAEVLAFLSPKLEVIMKSVAEGLDEWNKKEIDRNVYSKGSPEEYPRSMEFRDAWKNSTEGGSGEATAKLEYDPEQMSMQGYVTSFGEVNFTHSSVVDGSDVRDALADIIYNSGAGPVFGQGFWTSPRNAWAALINVINQGAKMRTWINRGAKNAGLKISWS